jgi:HSP20 family protein
MLPVLRNAKTCATTWSPLDEFEREISRFFDGTTRPLASMPGAWAPAVDVRETDDAYILHADLPGMKKEDITISVKDNTITVQGERKREDKTEEKGYSRYERSHGTFARSFTVRDGFAADKVEAAYADGVLSVTLPKLEQSKPRQVEVKIK